MQRRTHMWAWSRNTAVFSLSQSSFKKDWGKVETTKYSVVTRIKILFGKHGCHILCTKEERDHEAYYLCSVQKPESLKVWECISAYRIHSLHFWKDAIPAERHVQVLEQHMLPSTWRRPCIFQQYNAKQHTAAPQPGWVLTCPACSPHFPPIENIWHIMKWKIWQKRPQIVVLPESSISQECDNIHLQNLSSCSPQLADIYRR